MKLVFCPACNDIISLRFREVRTCACGAVGGVNVDTKHVVISAEAIPIDIDEKSLGMALRHRPVDVKGGYPFNASTVSEDCTTMVRLDNNGAFIFSTSHDINHNSSMRHLFYDAIPYAMELHRKTKDYVRATTQTPEHRGKRKKDTSGNNQTN